MGHGHQGLSSYGVSRGFQGFPGVSRGFQRISAGSTAPALQATTRPSRTQHKTSDSDGKLDALKRKAAGFKKVRPRTWAVAGALAVVRAF